MRHHRGTWAGALVLGGFIAGGVRASADAAGAQKDEAMTMQLTSAAFAPHARIPTKHTGEGDDVSPPLAWTDVPDGAQEFVLICDDPDAPTPEPWVHWVLYKIPGDRRALAEGDDAGGREGLTSWGSAGYRGPMPPPGHGVHRYFFKLSALDKPLDLAPGASKDELIAAITGHVIGGSELIGTYERR